MHEAARLDELDKDEFRRVAQLLRPELTDAQYDRMWSDFIRMKEARERELRLN